MTYKDSASREGYHSTATVNDIGDVDVAVGDLVVVTVGSADDTVIPTACSDSAGNTYSLLNSAIHTYASQFCAVGVYWCIATAADATDTISLSWSGAANKSADVSVYTVDGGDTVTVDDFIFTDGYSATKTTGEADASGDDWVAVAHIQGNTTTTTWSNAEIPAATAATVLNADASTLSATFYDIGTATASGLEAEIDGDNGGWTGVLVIFDSAAGGGGGSPVAIIVQQHSPGG